MQLLVMPPVMCFQLSLDVVMNMHHTCLHVVLTTYVRPVQCAVLATL